MDGDYGRRGEEKGQGRREKMEDVKEEEERKDGAWDFSVRLLAEAEVMGRIQGKRQERGKDECVCMSF
jgi:ribosome maturation protein Sdo1